MSEQAIHVAKTPDSYRWHPIPLPFPVTLEELSSALIFCPGTTRISSDENAAPALEVAVENELSAAAFQQRLIQALVDQRLRKEIRLKSCTVIHASIEAILRRTLGR
ncbi:hypothetical protein HNO92_004353 [Chromobacterium alkanivorans]|uniref:hypothetical protein n=1 Tax=Chromobacterium alkanivorans TaxID=1071719 RepID=UPI002167B464|nr:hypothetical protein [Chromobacterium alkanivorans]MCS3806744.1 hypothetical protein [Chromobacterium alkanivorans]MCS3821084.1 hypothetical protein [Chromobacterium alkanivorans]MCS3876004.1 hypothetical protein [Chromobacterium alkanivorans]